MSRFLQRNGGPSAPWRGYVVCSHDTCDRRVMIADGELFDQELLNRECQPGEDRKAYYAAREPQHAINAAQQLPDGWLQVELGSWAHIAKHNPFCSYRCLRLWAAQQERKLA
jgi:hypothetical protein